MVNNKEPLLAEAIDYTASTMKYYLFTEQADVNGLSDALDCTWYGKNAKAYAHNLLIKMEKPIGDILAKEVSSLTHNYEIIDKAEVQIETTASMNGAMAYPMLFTEHDFNSFCYFVASTFKDNLIAYISEEIKDKDAFITDDKTDDDVITICNHIKRMLLQILDAETIILNEELLRFKALLGAL